MTTFETPAPPMTPAQHRALTRGAGNAAGFVLRGPGVSSSTLISLRDNHWAALEWGTVTRRGRQVNEIVGATLTGRGRADLVKVNAKAAQDARNAEVISGRSWTSRITDPFAAVAAVNGPELVINF